MKDFLQKLFPRDRPNPRLEGMKQYPLQERREEMIRYLEDNGGRWVGRPVNQPVDLVFHRRVEP